VRPCQTIRRIASGGGEGLVAFSEWCGRVLAEYPAAREQPLQGNPLAQAIRRTLPDELGELLNEPTYIAEGSPGAGNWAETPWVAIFDPLVTTTAQRGYYIVFLFRGDGEGVYLSLNQGATQVHEEVGARYRDVLASRASAWEGLLPRELLDGLQGGPIDLGGRGWLTRGYQAGNVAAERWRRGEVPNDEALRLQVGRFVALYRSLTSSLDLLNADADPGAQEEEAVAPGEEGRRYRWHRRLERNPRLIRDAKRFHGSTCMVCGFNFEERYGEIGRGYIEAHHLMPMSEIGDRPREQDPRTDFAVVCPNCHRMLHTDNPPLALNDLRALLREGSGGRP
jgi:5-methylcytosine-specific restriction protein A